MLAFEGCCCRQCLLRALGIIAGGNGETGSWWGDG